MQAGFTNVDVVLTPGHRLRASFDLRNASQQTWNGADAYAVGYHLIDSETNTLIVDGERTPLPVEMRPGVTSHFDLDLALPPEPGRYRVFFSVMREEVAWFYERGWEFVLTEVSVSDSGEATLGRTRVTTAALLKRERFLSALKKLFTLPPLTLWTNRALIRSLVRRDILGRYRGSFGGSFWTILNPLLLILTYYFVFGVILQQRTAADPTRTGFLFYFLAGMLPWLAFSEAVGRAPSVMLEYRVFIKKLRFPVETLPANLVFSGLASETFGLILFLLGLLLVKGRLTASILWFPLLLLPQFMFTAGVCWFLAALGVFVRDLAQFNGFLLTVWFFMTPICYLEAAVPSGAEAILRKNPIFALVRGYRSIFLEGRAPAFGPLVKLWLVSTIVFLFGYAWFRKLRKSFADIL